MRESRPFWLPRAWWVLLLALALAPTVATAQSLTDAQQACLNSTNKSLQKLAAVAGRDVRACLRSLAKGQTAALGPQGTAEGCLQADVKGRLHRASEKARAQFSRLCLGQDAQGTPKLPPFGTLPDPETAVAVMIDAALSKEVGLLHDLFGSSLDAALVSEAADGKASKCQQGVVKGVEQCQDRILKEFNRCQKRGVRSHAGAAAIQSAEDLEACMGADASGQVAKACDDASRPDRIRQEIATKCSGPGVDLSDAFPGCNRDDPAELQRCLRKAAECRACVALNEADDLRASCPACIPDVPVQGLCRLDGEAFCVGGERDGLPCEDTLFHRDCPPRPPISRCLAASHFLINTSGAQPLLTLAAGFDMKVDCTLPDPSTGLADCTCNITNIIPFEIPIIGFICIDTFEGCPGGQIDCDGGSLFDAETFGDHNIGFCGLSDDPNESDPDKLFGSEECAAQCEPYCANRGPGWEVFVDGCEGYCRAGERDGALCEIDLDCPEGECVGADPVAHARICSCTCIKIAGVRKGLPGQFACQTGVTVQVEQEEPCQGVDGIDDATLKLGSQCVPATTEIATSQIKNANDRVGESIPSPARKGQSVTCGDILAGRMDPMFLAGNLVFYDSTLGDLLVPIIFACE